MQFLEISGLKLFLWHQIKLSLHSYELQISYLPTFHLRDLRQHLLLCNQREEISCSGVTWMFPFNCYTITINFLKEIIIIIYQFSISKCLSRPFLLKNQKFIFFYIYQAKHVPFSFINWFKIFHQEKNSSVPGLYQTTLHYIC